MREIIAAGAISIYFLVFTLLLRIAVYSALGALSGFFLGKARFDAVDRPSLFTVSALVSIAVFTLYAYVQFRFKLNLATSSDVVSVTVTLVFTLLLLLSTHLLVQRSLETQDPRSGEQLPFTVDMVGVVCILALVIAGFIIRISLESNRRFTAPNNAVSFVLPKEYQFDGVDNDVLGFTKYVPGNALPYMVKVSITENEFVSSLDALRLDENASTADGFRITVREYESIVETGSTPTRLVPVHAYEYSSRNGDVKVVVTVEIPPGGSTDHHRLALHIFDTLTREL